MERKLRYKFPKRMRITLQRDFDRLIRDGQKFRTEGFTFCILPNKLGYPRIGISISKKFGKSTERNTIKRKIREAFRLSQYDLPPCDIVCIPYKTNQEVTVDKIKYLLKHITKRFLEKFPQNQETVDE